MRFFIGYVICLIGVLLPWRLRVVFSELLGWVMQALYFAYFSLLKFIVSSLADKEEKAT